jgi:hypothetical protein
MTRLLLLAAKRPGLFRKATGMLVGSGASAELIRETVRKSSVEPIYERIYNSRPAREPKRVKQDVSR